MIIGKTGDSFGCVVADLLEQCVKDGKDSCTITMENEDQKIEITMVFNLVNKKVDK